LADNPALHHAASSGRAIVPLYLLEKDAEGRLGGAGAWWLHRSLKALHRDLAALGAPLVLRRGAPLETLLDLIGETGADTLLWNRRYDPHGSSTDRAVGRALAGRGISVHTTNASLLFEPDEVLNQDGEPFRQFAPFWRCCLARPEPARPLPRPRSLIGHPGVAGDTLSDWRLASPTPGRTSGICTTWTPGEDAAAARLADFIDERLAHYARHRDDLERDGTSRLSPYLAFGEIGPRQLWHAARRAAAATPGVDKFLRELGWREFCHHMLHHFPDLADHPLRPEFRQFPWLDDEPAWHAFTAGRTGYPLVDAGMRMLWETGWIPNRVRMVVASFLVKDLLLPWQRGEAWFRETLVDADVAINACNWQWVTGSAVESAPFFRIFNPVLQGSKFDPHGHFVRRWVPELSELPDRFVHCPWQAPADVLAGGNLVLGRTYPTPIVEHSWARRRALDAFERMRNHPQHRPPHRGYRAP
jgi:deoxyribodipyrimidine photo-lyase